MKRANREMKVMLMVLPKNFCSGQMAILGPKMAHPHNSRLTLRIFKNFAQ